MRCDGPGVAYILVISTARCISHFAVLVLDILYREKGGDIMPEAYAHLLSYGTGQ